MKKIKVTQKGEHFLALNQELDVKEENEKGHVWVDGIQNGTKKKVIEQILQEGEYSPVEEEEA